MSGRGRGGSSPDGTPWVPIAAGVLLGVGMLAFLYKYFSGPKKCKRQKNPGITSRWGDCDLSADELERRLRIDNAADGQFSETSGWGVLFGIGGGGPETTQCGAGEGPCGATNCPVAKQRRTTSDVLIPIIGGGLVFFGILGLLYKYFDVGTVVKTKVKSVFKQVLDIICDPQTRILPGVGVIGKGGRDLGPNCKSRDDSCDDTFLNKRQDRSRKKDVCGKDRIDPAKRRYPPPPTTFEFPIIPGLHDCSDDEDYEEGVFEAPGPHGKV